MLEESGMGFAVTKGVDFDDPQLNVDWLNLSFYDDRDYETIIKED